MDKETLKQINRLAFENGQMRFYLREAITTMLHADTFICTREKMHRTGIDLYRDLLGRMQDLIYEQDRRCGQCGGSLPCTNRNDATGECTCQD